MAQLTLVETDRSSKPLRASEELYRTLVESSPGLVWRCDPEGRYTFLNKAWERTLGYPLEEMLGRTLRDFQPPGATVEACAGAELTGFMTDYETSQLSKDGRELHLHFNAALLRDCAGRVIGSQGTAHDVTNRKRVERYEAGGREVLQILNEPGTLRESIQRVLGSLRSLTRCDAVGIRLQSGEDFPYFVQEGFSAPFLETENTLLKVDRKGVCRGQNGQADLECTCGLVVSGRVSPLLTARGSFWTNDSPTLLALPPEEDPRLRPRNQCIHFGYMSVALVPIRSKEKIVGLVQFNDRRPGWFSPQTVEALEDIGSHIGEALLRKGFEEALRESEQKLREYQRRLQDMAFEAAAVQERERRRIAVDLHDSIGQTLALAQIQLTAVRANARGAPRAAIEVVVALLAQAILDSRELVFALSPPVLYDLGLDAAISWLIDDLEANHGLKVVLESDGEPRSLDETTAVVIFRSVRELLMNVLKHAGTPAAKVSLHRAGEHLEVVVVDAGRGFDSDVAASAPSGGSFGLFSVREQINRLGGTVELTSSRGLGTQARVRVPVLHGPLRS